MSDELPRPGADLWDGRWDDHRWGDPQSRALIDGDPHSPPRPTETTGPTQPTEPTEPTEAGGAQPERPARRLTPLVAAVIGVAIGAALGVPVGLAHRPPSEPAVSSAPVAPSGNGGSASSGDVASKVDPSIVDITSRITYRNATAAGTGMILTADGEVLTNNHVIEGATSISATSVVTGERYAVTVVATDPTADVALLRLSNASGLTPIKPGDATKVGIGNAVVALGNAGGLGGTPAVATGFVTALVQSITASDASGANPQRLTGLIETDAAIRPGDSGGPLANTSGEVIGMDTAATINGGTTTSRGYAIPIQRALAIVHQMEAGHGSSTIHIGTRGMIGVQVSALSTGGGASVESVTSGSPAEKAGIKSGDTITSIDGQQVTSSDSLGKLVKAHAAGDRVTVGWTDAGGSQHNSRVTLIAGPPD